MLLVCIITSWFPCKRGLDFCSLNIWREKTKRENWREMNEKGSKDMILVFKDSQRCFSMPCSDNSFCSHCFTSDSLFPQCFLFCKERTLLRVNYFGINYWIHRREGELATEKGQIKKGEMAEQRKIWLSCENWENWGAVTQKVWNGVSVNGQ